MKKLKAWFIKWNERRKMAPFERLLLREQEFQDELRKKVLDMMNRQSEKK